MPPSCPGQEGAGDGPCLGSGASGVRWGGGPRSAGPRLLPPALPGHVTLPVCEPALAAAARARPLGRIHRFLPLPCLACPLSHFSHFSSRSSSSPSSILSALPPLFSLSTERDAVPALLSSALEGEGGVDTRAAEDQPVPDRPPRWLFGHSCPLPASAESLAWQLSDLRGSGVRCGQRAGSCPPAPDPGPQDVGRGTLLSHLQPGATTQGGGRRQQRALGQGRSGGDPAAAGFLGGGTGSKS